MRKTIRGHFNNFKPVEVIHKGVELFTGIKGIPQSYSKEMDTEVQMSDDKKKFENVMYTSQQGILTALTAMVPVANRMMEEDRYTSLAANMNKGIQLLATTATFINFRRFENVFKGAGSEVGKELARSKKVKGKDGKEYTLFLPPKPIKGKPLDKSKMFGGQITHLVKMVESGTKCGKHMGQKRKNEDSSHFSKAKRGKPDFRQRRSSMRGGRSTFSQNRGRGARQTFGWNDYNRPGPPFRQGQQSFNKTQTFPKPGPK